VKYWKTVLTILALSASIALADDITLADGKTVFHKAKIISQDAASDHQALHHLWNFRTYS
jgi:hypothetical protein